MWRSRYADQRRGLGRRQSGGRRARRRRRRGGAGRPRRAYRRPQLAPALPPGARRASRRVGARRGRLRVRSPEDGGDHPAQGRGGGRVRPGRRRDHQLRAVPRVHRGRLLRAPGRGRRDPRAARARRHQAGPSERGRAPQPARSPRRPGQPSDPQAEDELRRGLRPRAEGNPRVRRDAREPRRGGVPGPAAVRSRPRPLVLAHRDTHGRGAPGRRAQRARGARFPRGRRARRLDPDRPLRRADNHGAGDEPRAPVLDRRDSNLRPPVS